jgi:hypothetical protein
VAHIPGGVDELERVHRLSGPGDPGPLDQGAHDRLTELDLHEGRVAFTVAKPFPLRVAHAQVGVESVRIGLEGPLRKVGSAAL